jgi:hypothetical protein
MTEPRPNLAALLPELYDDDRRAAEAPSTAEILAYLEGELAAAEEEELQERLSFHPEATRLLLDLLDPSRLEGHDDAELPLPDPESLRERLRAEGLFDAPSKVVAMRRWVHPVYRWATAALLLLSAGLGIRLARQPDGSAAPDVALWELLPGAHSELRAGGDVIEAEPGFLVLYADEIMPEQDYLIVVVAEDGSQELRENLRTVAPGRILLRLDAGDLKTGRHEIRLIANGETTPLAVYTLDWRHP